MKMAVKWKILALPFIAGFLAFYVLPFGQSVYYSLIESAFRHKFVGLTNYQAVLTNEYYQLAMINTFEFTLISAILLVLLSLFLSLTLHASGDRVGKLRIALIMPMLLPSAAVIPIFKQLFPQNVLYRLMQEWRFQHLLRIPIILLFLWKNTGYNIILLTAALSLIPREVNEAAALDGSQGPQKLLNVTLPMIAPTLFFVAIMSVVQSLRVFKETYLLYGSYPDPSIYLVQHYMNNHFAKLNYQNLTAGAILFALPAGFVIAGYYRLERRWMETP